MSTTTTDDLNADFQDSWDNFRTTATRVAELQTMMWTDGAALVTGLLNGRLSWGEVNNEYWRFAKALSGLGFSYAQSAVDLTREHEERLREQFRKATPEPAEDDTTGQFHRGGQEPAGDGTTGDDTADAGDGTGNGGGTKTGSTSRTKNTKQQ
ncbi:MULTISPECIES: hypothetical protein [Streptomyces]|uniref:hypothetical protein n=1 Tax=Streptomyces TaxID=1883 RepID=UPI000B9E9CF3|nr:hypothetical protein [Streptomyces kasugaensis]